MAGRIQGKEANDYIAKVNSGKTPQQKQNFLQAIFSAPLKLGKQLGEDTAMQRGETAPQYLSQTDYNNFKNNKGLEFAKSGIGTAAFFLPGSVGFKGAKGLITAGALAGGATEFGNSQKQDVGGLIGDTVKGAGTGAATAGLLNLVGKGINKVANKGLKDPTIDDLRKVIASQGDDAVKLGNTGNLGDVNSISNALSNGSLDDALRKNGFKVTPETRKSLAAQLTQELGDNVPARAKSNAQAIANAGDDIAVAGQQVKSGETIDPDLLEQLNNQSMQSGKRNPFATNQPNYQQAYDDLTKMRQANTASPEDFIKQEELVQSLKGQSPEPVSSTQSTPSITDRLDSFAQKQQTKGKFTQNVEPTVYGQKQADEAEKALQELSKKYGSDDFATIADNIKGNIQKSAQGRKYNKYDVFDTYTQSSGSPSTAIGLKADPKKPTGVIDADNFSTKTINDLKKEGLPVTGEGAGRLYNKKMDEVRDILRASNKEFTGKEFADGYLKSFGATKLKNNPQLKAEVQSLGKDLVRMRKLNPEKVRSYIAGLDNELNPVYTKINMGNPLTDEETAKIALRKYLDTHLKKAVPKVKEPLSSVSNLYNTSSALNNKTVESKALNKLFKKLQTDDINELLQYREEIQNISGNARRAMRTGSRELAPKDATNVRILDAIDNVIAQKHPDLVPMLQEFDQVAEGATNAIRQQQSPFNANQSMTAMVLNPKQAIAETVRNNAGKVAGKSAEVLSKTIKTGNQTAQKLAQNLQGLSKYLESSGLPRTQIAAIMGSIALNDYMDNNNNGIPDSMEDGDGVDTENTQETVQANPLQNQRLLLAQNLMQMKDSKGKPMYDYQSALEQANAALQLQGYDTSALDQKPAKEKSAADKKLANQATTGLKALDRLSAKLQKDKSLPLKTKIPGIIQPADVRQYNNDVKLAAEMFGRVQSGGAINKEEEKRFVELINDAFADPETSAQKIEQIKEYFSGL